MTNSYIPEPRIRQKALSDKDIQDILRTSKQAPSSSNAGSSTTAEHATTEPVAGEDTSDYNRVEASNGSSAIPSLLDNDAQTVRQKDGPSLADIAASESYQHDKILADDKAIQDLSKKTLMFDTYLDMLLFFSPNMTQAGFKLHPWQLEWDEFVSKHKATIEEPFKAVLCASNGSGKDSFFIAPFAVWFILCKLKSRVVITSSSGVQLTAQTEAYIRNLCLDINNFLIELGAPKAFKVNQRYIRCLYTGSEIRLYATDEPGKAEGYHPMEPNAPFALLLNEAKSISEDIIQATKRCTGFSHYFMVSSPGEPKGGFYFAFTNWANARRVTSYDCTHIPVSEIESDKLEYGEHSAWFRSKHLALFTSIGGLVVITDEMVDKCEKLCKVRIGSKWPKRVGLDLAAGGDESVISIWQGNMRVYQYAFREKDTTLTAEIIDRELRTQSVPKDSTYITADDGGVGKGIIDNLVKMGWSIKRICNQSPALNKRMYGNRGAELYERFKRLVEVCFLLLPTKQEDLKFRDQLISRHYKQSTGGSNRIFLQDKKEAKAEGYPSPDRVDATVLAFSDLTVEDFYKATDKEATSSTAQKAGLTLEELVETQRNKKFGEYDAAQQSEKKIAFQTHFDNVDAFAIFQTDHQAEFERQSKIYNGGSGTTKQQACGSLSCLLG